jgi:hypothetical protein
MNYSRIYNQIIDRAKSENRIRNTGIYYERHHIVPKCLGGLNSKDNLIDLTAREHYICHKLLIKIYPDNKSLHHAYWRMSTTKKNGYKIDSRSYAEARQLHSIICKTLPHLKDKSITHRQNLSKSLTGKLKSNSHKQNLSISKQTKEYKNKMSISASNSWSIDRKTSQSTRISGINNPSWKGYATVYDLNNILLAQYDSINLLLKSEKVSKRAVKRSIMEDKIIAKGTLKGFKIKLEKHKKSPEILWVSP